MHPNHECENCGKYHTSFTLQTNNCKNEILQEKWKMVKMVMVFPLFCFGLFLGMVLDFKYSFINQCSERFTNLQFNQCIKLVDNVWDQPIITLIFGLSFCLTTLIVLRLTIFRGLIING